MKLKRLSALGSALVLSISSLLLISLPGIAHATGLTCTWTGATNDNFSNAGNWSSCNSAAPVSGDSLVFNDGSSSGTTTLTNDISGLSLDNIAITGSSSDNNGFDITGDAISLTGGITDSAAGATNSVGFSTITLSNSQTFTGTGDAALQVGPESGTGTLAIGSYTLTLDASAADSGIWLLDNVTGSGTIDALSPTSINDFQDNQVHFYSSNNAGFTGQINVEQGDVEGTAAGLEAGGITITNGATLDMPGTAGATLATPITMGGAGYGDEGEIVTYIDEGGNNGNLTLSGPITLTGDTALSSSSTITVTGSINGGYSLELVPGSRGSLDINSSSNSSTSSNGSSSGPVSVTTISSGTNDSSDTATLPVSTGLTTQSSEYVVDGTYGAITVGSGGLLKGDGTVDGVTVDSGGTVAPGHSPGCLTVSGNYSQAGTYTADLDGTTACTGYDQLIVTGTVNLTGGTLDPVIDSGFTPAKGDSFEIINNEGGSPVTGTFSYNGTNLAEGSTFTVSGTLFKITYVGGSSGNSVVLTVVSVPGTPDTGFGLTSAHIGLPLAGALMMAGGIYFISRKVKHPIAIKRR